MIGVTTLLGVIWAIYLSALALKIAFYFGLHPWAEVLRKEFGSLKKSLKEPELGFVKAPRKSLCFPYSYRLDEAMLYEWTICINGDSLRESKKGTKMLKNKLILLC